MNLINVENLDFMFCQFWKRRAPKHDETPSNKISKLLDMGPISSQKHEIGHW